MKKKHLQKMILGMTTMMLGTVALECASVGQATEQTVTQTAKVTPKKNLGRYSMIQYDEKKHTTTVTLPSDLFIQYLLDKGVAKKDIPCSLWQAKTFNVMKFTIYGDRKCGNMDLCISKEGMKLFHNPLLAYYLYDVMYTFYGYQYKGCLEKFANAVDRVIQCCQLKGDYLFSMRNWQFCGYCK